MQIIRNPNKVKNLLNENSQNEWIYETHLGVRYGLKGRIIKEESSDFQTIKIIESDNYGTSLMLDNCWMVAGKQEKYYHECLVQTAMCSAHRIQKVLIIGGGDGGSARECLMHKDVKQLDLIEIDSKVIDLSKQYLGDIGGKAWKDKRLNLQIKDGIKWVNEAKNNTYDVIIIDGSDPIGPAKGLYNKRFFEACSRILRPGGVFATQSESPEAFEKVHIQIVKTLRDIFDHADPMYGWVPMYPSGWWSWTFASMNEPRYLNPLKKRAEFISRNCHLWSPRWQKGAFIAMPAFIEKKLKHEIS